MEQNLSEYFNSTDFYEIVYNYQKNNTNLDLKDIIEFLTSINVKFMISLNEINNTKVFNIFNNKLLKEYVCNYNNQSLYDYNNCAYNIMIDTIKNYTKDENIINQLYNNVGKFNWKFHATNSTFINSIKKSGLNPTNDTPQQKINDMIKIFNKYSNRAPFIYQKTNSEGKVSFSKTPNVSYSYGIRSPEWFSEFVGASIYYDNIKGINRHAFRNRDYSSALNNLNIIFNNYKFSDIDKKEVIDFFNEYWEKYALQTHPVLIILKEETLESLESFKELYDSNLNIFDWYLNNLVVDAQSEKTIDASNAIYIDMAKYDKIIEYISNKKTQEKININCFYEQNQSLNEDGIFNLEIIDKNIFNQKNIINKLKEAIKGYEKYVKFIYEDNTITNIMVGESIAFPLIKYLGKNFNCIINIDNQQLTGENADYYNIYNNYIKKVSSLNNSEEKSIMGK